MKDWYHLESYRFRGTATFGGVAYIMGFRIVQLMRRPLHFTVGAVIRTGRAILGCFLSGAAFAWRGDESP